LHHGPDHRWLRRQPPGLGSLHQRLPGRRRPASPGSTCSAFQPEEKGYCGLTNTIETGCTAGKDCCGFNNGLTFVANGIDSFGRTIPEQFNNGAGGLTYVDDGFQGSGGAAPNYENGVRVTTGGNPGAALQILLGGVDSQLVTNMSGAWQLSFNVPTKSLGFLSFDYNLTQSPNYESNELSQVLVSLDGVLHGAPYTTFVDQVTGDGDGGPNITTGWKSIKINLGTLQPGTHLLRIGGFNNQKNNINEQTTILFDNVTFGIRADVCPDGFVCGPVYANNCDPCATTDAQGNCNNPCGRPVLRCGIPEFHPSTDNPNETAACADDGLFPQALCQEIEICAPPNATGSSDPTAGGGLTPSAFDAGVLASDAGTPTAYNPDPPCPGFAKCPASPQHRWCHYNVDLWNDNALGNAKPGNPTKNKDTPSVNKGGSSGQGSPVTFTFSPDTTLHYSGTPLPFGESNYAVDAIASFGSHVQFDLGPAHGGADIVNAAVKLHGDRCNLNNDGSQLMILGNDFFPVDAKVHFEVAGCTDAVTAYQTAVDRTKKAYRDAIDLLTQYNDRKAKGQKFQDNFCATLVGDPPAGFPPCTPNETAATTINRFIQFYKTQLGQIPVAFGNLAKLGGTVVQPLFNTAQRNQQTILQVTFPVGPVPCLLEVEAFVEYGLDGTLTFTISPSNTFNGPSEAQSIINVDGVATPYVLAGTSLFVGVGFGFNGFSVSAGVEGDITLGRLSLNAHAGAGLSVQSVPDSSPIPTDVAAVAPDGVAEARQTLWPPSGPKQYSMSLNYDYGLSVGLDQILQGTISGRVRIKVAFFSKTWRQTLLTFPGFTGGTIPLLSGGGNITAVNDDPLGWGKVQMPLPFVDLKPLTATEVLMGTENDYDQSTVGELFYDGMCQCTKDNDTCNRDADCCNKPSSKCFSDPLNAVNNPGSNPKVCTACRPANEGAASTCNKDSDCCSPQSRCLDIPDSLPAGVKVCTCVPAFGICDSTANCCTPPPVGTTPHFIICQDEPQDGTALKVCRTCRHINEECDPVSGTNSAECCDETGPNVDSVTCDATTASSTGGRCTPHKIN